MAVELWYGAKPANAGEQGVLVELYDFLRSQPDDYVVLSSFSAGPSPEIDLMVLKPTALFMAEVKHVWRKMVGAKQGSWSFINPDGSTGAINNPYHQVRSAHHDWRRWCQDNLAAIQKPSGRNRPYSDLDAFEYILLYPKVPDDSEIDIGEHPVRVAGLSKFCATLVVQTGALSAPFMVEELQTIPTLLKLTRWHIEPALQVQESATGSSETSNQITKLLANDDFRPPEVSMLVARGHEFSQPVFHLDRDCIVVGRDPSSNLVINHVSVSRKHAELRRENDRWIVRDLHSQNGTFVSYGGDPRLERRVERFNALKNGSIIRFGHTVYTVLLEKCR